MVLRAVAQVFEDFRYVEVVDHGPLVLLKFRARVGDRELEGWDELRFDADGRIDDFTVLVRPLSGLQALVARMQALLAEAGAGPGDGPAGAGSGQAGA